MSSISLEKKGNPTATLFEAWAAFSDAISTRIEDVLSTRLIPGIALN